MENNNRQLIDKLIIMQNGMISLMESFDKEISWLRGMLIANMGISALLVIIVFILLRSR